MNENSGGKEEEEEASSRCPVRHSDPNASNSSNSQSNWWNGWFSPNQQQSTADRTSGCQSSSPASLEEAARYAQTPQRDQRIPLGTKRVVSSIPRSNEAEQSPHHQHSDHANWIYPSEQQLFNAMRKKGWSNVPEESIPTVLQIHNTINESTWRQIQDWEGSSNLVLSRFEGRPNDLSPKAFLWSYLLRLYDAPFDRHDWYVDNASTVQRYVIDYYYLPANNPHLPPTPYIDARPALDRPRALYLHGRRILQACFPGIAYALQQLGRSEQN